MIARSLVVSLLCLAMVALPTIAIAQDMQSAPAADTANAADLIRAAQRVLGQVVKTAREDPILEPDGADAKPFWEAMKIANESLDKADTALTLEDDTFHSNLALAVAAVQQAEIALVMNGSENAALSSSMDDLANITTALDENYSKEAARLNGSEKLTRSERQQLDKLKAQQDELDKKLAEVEKTVGKDSEEIKKGIADIRRSSKQVRNATYTSAGFVGAMFASRMMWGWTWGWHWWWGPMGWWGPGYIGINIGIYDLWFDSAIYDWAIVDTYLDVAALDLELDLADAYFADEFDAVDLDETGAWFDDNDFGLEEGDLLELTEDIPGGWDDVESDVGLEVMDGFQQNFDSMPFEPDFGGAIDTFDDFGGYDDFGGGFDDFGGGFDDF